MVRWVLRACSTSVVGLTVCGLLLTGCSRAVSLSDDLARMAGTSVDDVMRVAGQEAQATGGSSDDALRTAQQRWAAWRAAASEVSGQVKEPACEAATEALGDALAGNSQSAADRLGAFEYTLTDRSDETEAVRTMLQDIRVKAENGQPFALTLMIFKATVCQVV